MNYIIIILAVMLSVSVAANKFQYDQVQELNQSLATERANVQTLKNTIDEQNATILRIEKQRATDQANMLHLGAALNKSQLEKEKEVAKFNAYRNRLNTTAVARPTLVGRIATRATARVFDKFFKASGGGETGGSDGAVSSTITNPDTANAGGDNGDNPGTNGQVE